MQRAAGVAVAIALAWPAASRADSADVVAARIAELSEDGNYKLRLASAIALSRSSDARALRALTALLADASEKSLRRIAVAGLAKQAPSAGRALRAEIVQALTQAAQRDRDSKIRAAAARAAKQLSALAARDAAPVAPPGSPPATGPQLSSTPAGKPAPGAVAGQARADAPRVFVKISGATDATRKLGADSLAQLTSSVRRSVGKLGFATSWPGALPTSAELTASSAHGFLLAATVKNVDIKRPSSGGAQISCTVSIMVTPWHGVDGKELWEADRAATAAGSARAETGTSERDIAGGMRDCVEAVAAEVAERQVAPFLRRLSSQ